MAAPARTRRPTREDSMSTTADTSLAPWAKPFWKPARGKEAVLFYLVAVHAIAVVGLVLFPLPSLRVFLLALGLACIGGLGTTVCYHRALAHRTVKLHPTVEHF